LKADKSKEKLPTLGIKIETKWLKINNKIIVKGPAEGKTTIKIGGEEYHLQTSDELTDQGSSDEESQVEEFQEDSTLSMSSSTNNNNGNSEIQAIKEKYEAEIRDLVKEKERLEKQVSSTGGSNTEEVEDLKTDKARLDKKLDRLSKENDELKNTKGSSEPSSPKKRF